MNNLSARSKALSAAVGSADSSLKAHAKTIDQLSRNNAVLTNEIGRVRKEIAGMGTEFKFATGASASFRKAAVSDLKAYESALKGIRLRGLTEDLKSVAQEQKRLGKDAQFVGRSLIIGLTTPMIGFARYGLQALVSVDKEFVRLNKVLENVAPNLEAAAKKMNVDLVGATKEQSKQLQGMVDRYDRLDKSLGKISNRFGLAKSLTVGLAGDFAELGIQSEESIVKITELAAVTEKLGGMDIGAAKDLVQSLYFQAQRAMQMSGQSRKMTFEEREIAAIGAATSQLNLFNSVENVTALTLRDLGDAFPEVAAAGSSFGLSMTELAGMLAPMKAAGFEVGASANSIKVSLQRLVAPTKQNAELFKQLSKEYNTNFTAIKGTGLDAIQSLIDAFNELKNTEAGQEGAMEFFAKVFGVRQGPRMEVALAQMADFDEVLKSNTVSMDSAEKKLQGFANQAIISANKSANANLPLIKSYQDIGIIARIATAQIKEGETAQIDGFGRVTLAQVKEARKVRQAVTDELVKAQRTEGIDLIGQVNTEAGRASFIQLAGAANAAEVAQRELNVALGSLDTQISILKNNFKAFATDIIKGARPAIEKITDISNKLITAWSSLDGRTKQLISTIALLTAGATALIGPLIFVFGQFRLAMGSVAKVLLSFLPALKTLSIEAVASSSAMLRLSKPLTVVGDTVVNTNGKFATFIATLASGEGPVGRLANKIGLMTGALQKQSTAPMALSRQVNAQKAVRESLAPITGTSVIDPITGAPVAAKPSFTSQMKSALKLQKTGVMSGAAGVRGPGGRMGPMDADEREILRKTEEMIKQSLLAKGYPTTGGRGPGGRFSKSVGDMAQEAVALQASGVTSGAAGIRGASGRFRRMTTGEKDALQAYEDTRETLEKRTLAKRTLSRKDLDLDVFTGQNMYKGREITADRASDIYRGGIKGRAAQVAEAVGRSRDAAPERMRELGGAAKGLATAPVEGYKKSVQGAKNAMLALRMQHAAAGVEAPRFFARMSAAVKGFVTATNLGTAALKIMKLTLIASGIGIIILAIGVAVMLVMKNMDKFKEAGSSGIKVVKEAFDIFKNAVLELARPIIDLFSSFGNGAEGASGAVSGLGNIFNVLVGVLKIVANVFSWLVKTIIQPYLYIIVNIVKFVISLFTGQWMDALKSLGAAFGGAFALIGKIVLGSMAFLVKQVINIIFELPSAFLKAWAWGIEKATNIWFGFAEFLVKQIEKVPVIGKFFGGVASNTLGVLKTARDAYVGTVKTVAGAVNTAGDFLKQGIDKGVKTATDAMDKLGKGGVKRSKGKVTFGGKGGKKDEDVEVDTDPMQEQIANATGEGLAEGADAGARELAKRAAQALKDIKKEVQEEIASRIKDAMNSVVDSITNSLKDQKEASLSIYDAQIKKIEDVAKAEEKLTKEQEYQNKLREAEEQRVLNRLNTRRNYAMAVYAGQIDEARAIADAGARQDTEDTKSIGVIRDERVKELAEENRKVMIDSIKEAKDNASKYFDEMIKSFTEAAKKITQFPPTTAEEFNTMLNQLIEGGNGFVGAKSIANSMGTVFSESFGGALGQLGVNASGPLTSSLAAIGKTLTENNPFGPTGIWSTTIDASIDALTRKYKGLSQTLTTVIDTNSEAFSKLLTTYTAYQDIVNPAGAGSSSGGAGGGTGAAGTGGAGGAGGGAGGETNFANQPIKKGKVTPNQMARVLFANYRNADRNLLVDYLTDAFTTLKQPPVDSAINKFKKFLTQNPAIKQAKNARILTMVTNAYNRGSSTDGYDGYKLYEMGGMLPYSKGGATEGPVQQGIPAILHGGEYVVRNSAVNKYGWGMMQQINQGTYKPKPFANGGMIDSFAKGGAIKKPKKMVTGGKSKAPEREPDKKIKQDPAQAEWSWQQNNGGFTEAYMDTIGKGESSRGKNWGKKPDWFGRTKTSDGWMGGGLRTADATWVEYGGSEFAKTADLATKLQQMVVKNRIAIFGWIRNVPVNSSDFPAGATLLNPPLGTGKHGFDRSHLLSLERGLFKGKPEKLKNYRSKEKEFPFPENFNENMSYISQAGYDPFKNFGSPKGGFNTEQSKDAYVNYFRNKPKDFDKITMPFSKPIWINNKKRLKKEPTNARKFDNFGAYSPPIQDPVESFSLLGNIFGFAKGGLVGKAVGKKIAKPKTPEKPKTPSAADFRKADYLSDWDMQVIGVNAKKQMAEQKKSIWGKIKSAVKKPFVAAKNWASNQLMSNIYGSQTGSGMTGSATLINRSTNPNVEQVVPGISGLNTSAARGGAGWAKSLTEFNPITGAYFPLERTFDIYNEGLSGKDRTLAGLQSAVSLIGPDTVFGLDAPRNPSIFLPKIQDSIGNSKGLSQLLTPQGRNQFYWNKIKTPLQNKKSRFKNYKNDFITAFKPDAIQIPALKDFDGVTELVPARSWLEKIRSDAASFDPDFGDVKNIYQNLTSSPYKNIWQDIAASRPMRTPFQSIKNAAEQAYWSGRYSLMQKFPKLGKLDENINSFKDRYKPSYRDGMNNLQNWFEESNPGSNFNINYPLGSRPRRPGLPPPSNPGDSEYRNFIQEWYGERYGRDMGYDTAKSRFDVISTHFKRTGLYGRYNNIKQGILSSRAYPTQAASKFSSLFNQYFKQLPSRLAGNTKAFVSPYKEKFFDFLIPDSGFAGFGKGSMELPPWTVDDLMRDMPRMITKGYIDDLMLPLTLQKERILQNIQNSKLGRTGGYKKAMGLFRDKDKLQHLLFENPRLKDVFNQNPNLSGIFAKHPELLEAALADSSIVKILTELRPSAVKTAMDGRYGIIHSGGGSGYHQVKTYRSADTVKNSIGVPVGNSSQIHPTVDFSFYVQDYMDQVTQQLTKSIRISGLYAMKGIGQSDLFKVLAYVYENIIKPEGITSIHNGSYSKYSYALSQNMGEIMKVMDPNVKIITPDLQDWVSSSMNGIDFGASTGYPTNLRSPEEVSDWFAGKNPLGGGNNAVADIADRLRIELIQQRIIKSKMDAKRAGTQFKSGDELLKEASGGNFNGGLISRYNGGMIPGFGSQGVPALLHGGEYVVNASAVKNIGIAALQAMNNMRFNTPKAPSYAGPVNGQSTSTSTTHIYVENFIGEKQWFESMMKDYNVTVAPQNQKAAGLNNTTISTYSGINRGL
jgi:TP901 family phage tail tape measure protein